VVEALGGGEPEAAEVNGRMLARAVLPKQFEVREGDVVHRGVAVKAERQSACVAPLFWPNCRNGAILAHPTWEQRFDMNAIWSRAEALRGFAAVVRGVGRSKAFAAAARALRRTTKTSVNQPFLPLLMRPCQRDNAFSGYMTKVWTMFYGSDDQTEYFAINAVSSVARDIIEPELKWEFEVAAGEMILPSPRREPHDPQSVAIAVPRVARG
jgi:hypothetical protein